MKTEQLVYELIQAAYDSGYYSGKKEDGQAHHLQAIEKRNDYRDRLLKQIARLKGEVK